MRYIETEGRIVWSASDLKAAAECEFAWLRAIDAKLGRVPAVEEPEDATLVRAGLMGGEHERRVLARYRVERGDAVIEIAETSSADAAGLARAVAETNAALASPDAEVLYQAAFATEEFVGFADFLVRDSSTGPGQPGRWRVQDTKLARTARVTALMQLAAYVDQLDRLGVPRADEVELLLGDGSVSVHAVDDVLPLFSVRRARLRALIADRQVDLGADGAPVAWGDPRGDLDVVACGRCATCELEVVAHRDLLLVAGMRPVQRERLRVHGICTIDDLASAAAPPPRMNPDAFASLVVQARLQLDSPAGVPAVAASGAPAASPSYEVVEPAALSALPRPDHGDVFFDFEGDPLHTEGAGVEWGIDYLFGWVDAREQYSALWAHTFRDEKRALEDFCDFIAARREAHPTMHIYHYAPYEPNHLAAMAARHGVREGDVDRMLRDELFVDLYPVVRRALRVGSRSYSIKKLEPLYMGDQVRESDVQRGDESIVRYVAARALIEDGDADGAQAIFDDLADYNRYDCVSTRRLRDWLVERAREARVLPALPDEAEGSSYEPSPRALTLTARADDLANEREASADPTADETALRLGSAAIDYYPREAKTFWAAHFQRLREPVSLWAETRDVVALDPARCRVLEDWHRPEGKRVDRRVVELRGEPAPGTRISAGSEPFALYERPAPFPSETSQRWIHVPRTTNVRDELEDGAIVEEFAVAGVTWAELPLALTPAAPPRAGNQQQAIDDWADAVADAAPAFPGDPATDILRRIPPRTRTGGLPDRSGIDVDAIVTAVRELDHSYLAVQGPPGTGKTYVGSHVVARLVAEHGYRVGVVAQSHAVVEHMLERMVAAGVPGAQVAKAPKGDPEVEPAYTVIPKNGVSAFTAENPEGFVIGGTAWDFSHTGRVPRASLDLLVIDEAGQFSLASTIAVSRAAQRLLLLGDPQQLPQVSQGTHPEPVDTSALGWVMAGVAVVRPEYGFFLDRSWRMHPGVAEPVSHLSYVGKLASHEPASWRRVAGVEPGLHVVPVRHHGNATESPEEAAEVSRIVGDLIGRAFTDIRIDDAGGAESLPARPLAQTDIIVVTPYNAQQQLVSAALASAGFGEVRVGTVDKFQGQEAAVSIVSLAASSGRDAPRGADFLLLQNRLNVAISRAKCAAYLIHSPALLDDLPRRPEGAARLSAFARLVGAV